MNPKIIKKINQIFHDEESSIYDKLHPEIIRQETLHWNLIITKLLKLTFLKKSSIKILDIGSGTGFVPFQFLRHLDSKSEVICIDISLKMLKKLNQNGLPTVWCDAENLPFKNASVNLITCNSVLHHLPNYRECIKEMDRILSRGGIIVIAHEPNRRFGENKILVIIYYIISRIVSLYSYRRGYKQLSTAYGLHQKVISQIKEKKITKNDLNQVELQQIVDIHSITASGKIDNKKGFYPNNLIETYFSRYNIIELQTYNHIGKINPNRNMILNILNKILKIFFKNDGLLFSIVIKKI